MSSLAGWSNLESFITSTTPVVTSPYSIKSLISAFKHPCAFGVEVKLNQDEIIFFLPTLSAISVPGTEYYESSPPYLRQTAYHKLEQLDIAKEIDENSWMALLWIPINKLPPGKIYGSVLVYYSLFTKSDGFLPLHGLLPFKIPEEWVKVYENNAVNSELSNYWEKTRESLKKKAKEFHTSIGTLHHDFNYIMTRENVV